jgi:hypothetical protein
MTGVTFLVSALKLADLLSARSTEYPGYTGYWGEKYFALLHLPDHPGKGLKKRTSLVGAWGCFRVVLYGHDRFLGVHKAFQGLIVQIDVGLLNAV